MSSLVISAAKPLGQVKTKASPIFLKKQKFCIMLHQLSCICQLKLSGIMAKYISFNVLRRILCFGFKLRRCVDAGKQTLSCFRVSLHGFKEVYGFHSQWPTYGPDASQGMLFQNGQPCVINGFVEVVYHN